MKNKKKVFLIGENKTGTTSLTKAFQLLGYKNCPESIWYHPMSKYYMNFINGDYSVLFPLVDQYDFFEDRPWNFKNIYKILEQEFPEALFILTIREPKSWLESSKRWSKKTGNRTMFYWKHVSNIQYGVDDWLTLKDDEIINIYNQINQEKIDYFSNTKKLLIMDLEKNDGWEKLCTFLNCPIPNTNFPHLNKTK